jgi:hypothetical protein
MLVQMVLFPSLTYTHFKFCVNMSPCKMALVTNKSTNHSKLKTCTYAFKKKTLKL